MPIKRTVVNKVGQGISIEMASDGATVRIARTDIADPAALTLSTLATRILAAFLSSALVTNRADCEPERIDDVVITMHTQPGPLVRVEQTGSYLDIHAPGWQTVALELSLVIPRMTSDHRCPAQTSAHHPFPTSTAAARSSHGGFFTFA